jgi:thiol-disulfide isomerase/thioredoxin
MPQTMKLLKFGAEWCGPCQSMKKAKTLEKFAEKHPDVKVEDYWTKEYPEGHAKEGQEIEDDPANVLAEKYEIQALPTLLFIDAEDEDLILAQDEGAMSMAMLEKLHAKATKALAKRQKEEGNAD